MNLYSDALAATRKKASALMDSITQERIQAELLKLSNQAITPKELASNVRELVENSGVGSLTDRGGKTWQLDTYANMVARTEYAHIVNEATKVQSLKEGYDLVVFTRHGATDSCALLEGVVVSLTGLTPGYQKLDSAIMGTHMLAPNCRHTYTPVSPADAKSLAS